MDKRILQLKEKMMHVKKSETLRAILLKGIVELEKEYGIQNK
jgi:hypothetical protein